MNALLAALRYARLKVLTSLIRVIARLVTTRVRAKPDAVLNVPSRDAGRTIRVHIYSPAPTSTNGLNEAPQTPRPVLINFFGSGFVLPGFGNDDFYCHEISRRTGHIVLDVDYRLSPEHPFPAAVHDAEDVVRHVLSSPDTYDVSHISVSGFSSGGTLTLLAPALFPINTFRSIIAFYPSVNMAKDPALRKAPVENPKIKTTPPSWTRLFREGYLRGMDPRDPRISPIYGDTANFPKDTLIITTEYDVSALDAEEFARKAQESAQGTNRRVILRRIKGCPHNFDKSEKYQTQRTEAYTAVADLLAQSLAN
ncbi:putative carboxylesterase [Xylaria intraflava]|nr:putative carboxylesterase [Xylaria intraflava]